MDEYSPHEPFLSCQVVNKKPLFVSVVRWILKIVMWVVFIAWVTFIFLYPLNSVKELIKEWTYDTKGTFLGIAGGAFLVFGAPILIIAVLSVPFRIISKEEELQKKKTPKKPSYRLWTFPVLVEGPFGVVSAAEFIGILLFAAYIFWAVSIQTMMNLKAVSDQSASVDKISFMLQLSAISFASIGIFCVSFLFLPIARGSVILRLIDIPFEHAARYHVWLGHLTMLLFTLHGLSYIIAWAKEGLLLHEIIEWNHAGVANLAGVISLLAGLLMWVTSLSQVRKRHFELFFYTHQLYALVVIFLALHVADIFLSMAAGGIFLFMLDRFLRFYQSRTTVDIISASYFPCGVVKLVLSIPKNVRYNALSFVFLRVRELSWLQWHPFSVSSGPQDGKFHLSVLVKDIGDWTTKLKEKISSSSGAERQKELLLQPYPKLTASVEGPYGQELPYYLMYEKLILVAGGIGISPFLAILSDILYRIKQGKPCLTRNILLVWAVKRLNEVSLLSTLDNDMATNISADELILEIYVYVTQESESPLEEGRVDKAMSSFVCPVPNARGISVLASTGDKILSGLHIITSIVGFVISTGLCNMFYINPLGISGWYQGLLFVVCMLASVIIFGSLVIGLWHVWQITSSAREECNDNWKIETTRWDESSEHNDFCLENLSSSTAIQYGARPEFKEIFGDKSRQWGSVDVGVIVCGPASLGSSVAKECRSLNIRRQNHHPIFHFNSHSFDL